LALAAMAFFAVGREGLESVFFLLAVAQQSEGWRMPVGAALGLAAAVGVGFAIYLGGVRLNLGRFFRWTGVFILFVAAGLLAGALRALHEAGLWNGLQATAFDASSWLPQDSVSGTLLEGVFGYQAAPTKRIADLAVAPKNLVGGAAELIEEVASKKISGEEDRYSRTDLWDFQSNVDGAREITTLLDPLIRKQDARLGARLRSNFQKIDALLAKYKTNGGGFESYEKLTARDRGALKAPISALAEDLSTLKGALGVE
jgi:hypothetical protein